MIYLPNCPASPDGPYCNDTDFTLMVGGVPCPVRTCRVSAMRFNRFWPGHQRSADQTEPAYYAMICADEPVEIEAISARLFENAVVRPLSRQITPERSGQSLRFTLRQHGAYVLELDGIHGALHLFYDAPREPVSSDATYTFGPGMHFPGGIRLRSNESVYIHPEAVVYGSIYCKDAENVRIYGGGVLDGSCEERIFEDCYQDQAKGNIRMRRCKNIHVEDVVLLNANTWAFAMFECENAVIDGVKILGQWRYNTDGIDLVNSRNIQIKNSFVRSFDDSVVIKALYNWATPIENIRVENCVLWCDWGKTLEIGLETSAVEYRDISYRNCDLIHNSTGGMAISNGHYADIHHISYEDIRMEYQRDNQPMIFQASEDMVYDPTSCAQQPDLLRITNTKMREDYSVVLADERDEHYGSVHHISYRNIQVFLEEGMARPVVRIFSKDPQVPVHHVQIGEVYLNGRPAARGADLEPAVEHCEDLCWE